MANAVVSFLTARTELAQVRLDGWDRVCAEQCRQAK